MTGAVFLHADPKAWLAREIDVGNFLARVAAPIVPPTRSVNPGPHCSGGLWLSLWQYAEVIPVNVSAGEVGQSLRSVHDAVSSYPGTLPPRSAIIDEIDELLTTIGDHACRKALVEERHRLAPLLPHVDAEGQPLHGDASLSNLLATRAGVRWNDFEDVCFGSPTWDVVGLVDDARKHNGDEFATELLADYGRDTDPDLVQLVRDTHALYGALWHRYCEMSPASSI